ELHWFKYEAYFTWLSGFALMAVMYYFGAETFLIDRDRADISVPIAVMVSLAFLAGGWLVYDLLCRSTVGRHTGPLALAVFVLIVLVSWGLSQLFSDRATFLHVGSVIGTIMSANVFFIIIPNQKKVVADLKAGRQPAAELGQQAKQRSLHNNYLTLPVLLLMVSAHYPLLFAGQATWGWLVIALVLLIGGVVRHFFNTWHTGARGSALLWQWPLAVLLGVVLAIFLSTRQTMPLTESVSDERALAIIQMHCVACHAATPTHRGFKSPPAGLTLDVRETVILAAERVMAQAVLSKAMPLGNATGMTDTERAELGTWLRRQLRP
ncbi:MAG TPA: cysteine desulfurase, partial [Gammaproteobacteria bacterium]|nr:cysteine desulfurase [Gammaproteobacteria bacterium]